MKKIFLTGALLLCCQSFALAAEPVPVVQPAPEIMAALQPASLPEQVQQTQPQLTAPAAEVIDKTAEMKQSRPLFGFEQATGEWQEVKASEDGLLSISWNKNVWQEAGAGHKMPAKISVIVREVFADSDACGAALHFEGGTPAGAGAECLTHLSFLPAEMGVIVEERSFGGKVIKVNKRIEMHPLHRYLNVFAAVMDELYAQDETKMLGDLSRYSFLYFEPSPEGRKPVYADLQTMYMPAPGQLVYWQLEGNMLLDVSKVKLVKKLLLLDTLDEVVLTERSWLKGHCGDDSITPGGLQADGKYSGTLQPLPKGTPAEKGLMQLRYLAAQKAEWIDRYK